MNDPLEDIQTFLSLQGYLNVFVDGFVLFPSESLDNLNQINIQGEPSTTGVELSFRTLDFGIYVKNVDKQLARNRAMQIRTLLLNRFGKLIAGVNAVVFKKIWVETEPYFWSKGDNNTNIYLARFQTIISDKTIKTVYDSPPL